MRQRREQIVLDLDATDDPCTASRKAGSSTATTTATATCRSTCSAAGICWRPSCGRSNIDGAAGAVEEVARIVGQIRGALARGADRAARRLGLRPRGPDGLVRGQRRRLRVRPGAQRAAGGEIAAELAEAAAETARPPAQPARRFKDFLWTTRESWSRRRRVVGKAEWTQGEANPRFVVTSLGAKARRRPRALRGPLLRARRDGEPHQGMPARPLRRPHLGATMRANQLRLWFASMAYVLLCALRRIGLPAASFADATCGTIRLKLLKIGALVRLSVRRVKIAMASGFPLSARLPAPTPCSPRQPADEPDSAQPTSTSPAPPTRRATDVPARQCSPRKFGSNLDPRSTTDDPRQKIVVVRNSG